MRVSEKVTAWWLKGYAWILLPLVAASWLPGVPPLCRVVVGAVVALAGIRTGAALRARRDGGPR